MQEAFEKNIEQQLKSFQLQPNDTVWQEVEAALHTKKRRAAPIWWMTFAGTLLMGCFLLFNYFNTIKTAKSALVQATLIKSDLSKEAIEKTNKQEIIIVEKQPINTKNKSDIILTKKHELIEKEFTQKSKSNSFDNRKHILILKTNAKTNVVERNDFKTNQENNTIQIVTPIKEQRQYLTKADLLLIQSLLPTKFEEKQLVGNNSIQLPAVQKTTIKDSSNKNITTKQKWFITGSLGLLTTKQNSFLDNSTTLDALANFGSSSSVASSATTNKIKYPNGTALMLGGGFQQQVSKKWSFNAALQYKLLSTKVSIVDSLFRFQSNSYKAHWIEIPINISYQLNNAAHPFYLTAGLSGAFAFASNWSYADLRTNWFYNDKTKNRKLFVNAQVGAAYNIQKNWRMQVSVEKSLTSVHRKVANKFYYTQFNVQVFKFIQPKSKK